MGTSPESFHRLQKNVAGCNVLAGGHMNEPQLTFFPKSGRRGKLPVFSCPEPFATAIIDPPWPYASVRGGEDSKLTGFVQGGNCAADYTHTMTIPDMAQLPVSKMVGGYLLVWATMPFVQEALLLIDAWGFDYVTGMCWAKWNRGLQIGVGYWFRGAHELVLVSKKPGVRSIRTTEASMFLAPRRGHSEKPDYLHELAERHFPGPYLELFGRRPRANWEVVGDQLPGNTRTVEHFAASLGFALQPSSDHFKQGLARCAGFRGARPKARVEVPYGNPGT